MSHHPEYDAAVSGRRFSRDVHGKRLAPLSQLNSPIGRKLARPQTLAQARLMREVPETAYYDTSHLPADLFSRDSAIGICQVQRQLSAPPPTRSQHVQTAAEVARSAPSQLGCPRKLSDRDLLTSQQSRHAASSTIIQHPSNASKDPDKANRPGILVSLKRTLTMRRSKTTRETTVAKGVQSQELPGRSATFSAGSKDRPSEKHVKRAPSGMRRFSFDYGPEILSLASSQDHVQMREPRKWCRCKNPVIPNSSKTCVTCPQVPKLTEQLKPRQNKTEVVEGAISVARDGIRVRNTGSPPQTFDDILGCVQRVPTALMES
jgi:hypothetical protein